MAVALAACGSSGTKTVPKAQIISKGDVICTNARKLVTATAPNVNPVQATSTQIKALAPILRQITASTQASVNGIAALGTPDKDAALLSRLIAGGRRSIADDTAAAAAAQSGDVAAFRAAFARAQGDSGAALAKQFGFKVCAQGG
jgi:hypothetical protein